MEGGLSGYACRVKHGIPQTAQYLVFTVEMPMQHGLAAYMANPAPYLGLPACFTCASATCFAWGLENTRFMLLPADGMYFQRVRYNAISSIPDAEFAQWLRTEIKVAAIPVSAFYRQGMESGIVRLHCEAEPKPGARARAADQAVAARLQCLLIGASGPAAARRDRLLTRRPGSRG